MGLKGLKGRMKSLRVGNRSIECRCFRRRQTDEVDSRSAPRQKAWSTLQQGDRTKREVREGSRKWDGRNKENVSMRNNEPTVGRSVESFLLRGKWQLDVRPLLSSYLGDCLTKEIPLSRGASRGHRHREGLKIRATVADEIAFSEMQHHSWRRDPCVFRVASIRGKQEKFFRVIRKTRTELSLGCARFRSGATRVVSLSRNHQPIHSQNCVYYLYRQEDHISDLLSSHGENIILYYIIVSFFYMNSFQFYHVFQQ